MGDGAVVSGALQSVQHFHDRHETIADSEERRGVQAICFIVRREMFNGLFGFTPCDAERLTTSAIAPAAEAFFDIRANGLDGLTQLSRVEESARSGIEESIHFLRHQHGGFEYGWIAAMAHT